MASPELGANFSPSKSQIAAARVEIFLDITARAKKHAKEKSEVNPLNFRKRRRDMKSLKDQFTDEEVVRREVPFSVDPRAAGLTRWQRTKILTKAAQSAAGLTQKQRINLFEAAGYTHDEAKTLGKKIGISLGASIAASSLSNAITAAAITHETISPTIEYHHWSDPKTALAIVLSDLAQYGAISLNALSNKALLHRIGFNPNILSTTGYHLADKLLPSEKAKNRASDVGSFGTAVLFEPFVLATSLATPAVAVGRNVAAALYSLGAAGVNYGLLLGDYYREHKQKRKKSGDIFNVHQ